MIERISDRIAAEAWFLARGVDPLIDDLRLTLVARNRYRAHVSGAKA